jgi:hypothetical protein
MVRVGALGVAVAVLATAAHHRANRLPPEVAEDNSLPEPEPLPLPTDLRSEFDAEPPEPFECCRTPPPPIEPDVSVFLAYSPDWIEVPPDPAPLPHWWSPDHALQLHIQPQPDPPIPAPRRVQAGVGNSFASRRLRAADIVRGGSADSLRAVERAQAWVARQQKQDGSWAFDGDAADQAASATGAALLPFLGVGHTHRSGKYQKVVASGVRWLIEDQKPDGSFVTAPTTTGHALAALALAECYGLTKDNNLLRGPALAALNVLRKSQNGDGGWGEKSGDASNSAATGWALQALHAGRAAKLIEADDRAFKSAAAFLAAPATDPAGALSRVLVGGRIGAPGFVRGEPFDAAYLYHATWVMFLRGGDDWETWNVGPVVRERRVGGTRDEVVSRQVKMEGPRHGSWEPDESVGREWGRLGTTVLSALTLEVYYRYPRE